MDCDKIKVDNLKYLIKELTTTGKEDLNERLFKKLKNLCKTSDFYVKKLHEFLFQQFSKKHAEIRFSCFQICDQIFRKSHYFRSLVLEDFCKLVDLVFGQGSKNELKPITVAKKLKKTAITAIKEWHDKFGETYHELVLGMEYLMRVKNVDFEQMTAMTLQERDREEERRRASQEIKAKRVEKVQKTLEENVPQIKNDLIAFRNCFKLLIPDVNDFFIPISDDDPILGDLSNSDKDASANNSSHGSQFSSVKSESALCSADSDEFNTAFGSDFARSAGILKDTTVKIDLAEIRRIQETQDNHTVVENLKELINTLSTVWLPKIKYLQQSMLPYSEGNSGIIKELVQLKSSLESAIESYTSVTIIPISKKCTTSLGISDDHKGNKISNDTEEDDDDDDDDDDDFIEVTDTDPRVSSALHSEAELLGILSNSASSKLRSWVSDLGAGTSGSTESMNPSLKEKSLSSNTACLTPESFGKDWKPPSLHVNPLAGVNQVWVSTGTGEDADDCSQRWSGMLGIATTPVELPSQHTPVRWQCRAPLPSGRLCPRRDRFKCPLHGRVLPRCSKTGQADLAFATTLLQAARQRESDNGVLQESCTAGCDVKPVSSCLSAGKSEQLTSSELRDNSSVVQGAHSGIGEHKIVANDVSHTEHGDGTNGGETGDAVVHCNKNIRTTERGDKDECVPVNVVKENTEEPPGLAFGTSTAKTDVKRNACNQLVNESRTINKCSSSNGSNKLKKAFYDISKLEKIESTSVEVPLKNGCDLDSCVHSSCTEKLQGECGIAQDSSCSYIKSFSSRKKLCSKLNQISGDSLNSKTSADETDVLENSYSIAKSLAHKERRSKHPAAKDNSCVSISGASGISYSSSLDTSATLGLGGKNIIDLENQYDKTSCSAKHLGPVDRNLQTTTSTAMDDKFYSSEKFSSCEEFVTSVWAAEELVVAVEKALQQDRRRRMNLDQDWQDPTLLAEIKAATGVDLDMSNVRKRRRGPGGGLTDLKKAEDTPRKRLAKKVLSKRAAAALKKSSH